MHQFFSLVERPRLSPRLIFDALDGHLHGAEVFDFRAVVGKFGLPHGPHRHVDLKPKPPLVHVAVAHLDIFQQVFQSMHIGVRLGRVADVRFRDDFQKRSPRTVQIDKAVVGAVKLRVDDFARIFFEMDVIDANPSALPIDEYIEIAIYPQVMAKLGKSGSSWEDRDSNSSSARNSTPG